MIIKQTLILNDDEFNTINKASSVVEDIFNCLDCNEELVADSAWSYDDVKDMAQFLAELVSCTVSIERNGY